MQQIIRRFNDPSIFLECICRIEVGNISYSSHYYHINPFARKSQDSGFFN